MINDIVEAAVSLSTMTDGYERVKIAEAFRQRLPNWIFNNLRPDAQYAPFEGDDYYDERPCTREISKLYTEILEEDFDFAIGIKYFSYVLSASTYRVDNEEHPRSGLAINITIAEENGDSHTETLYYRFNLEHHKLRHMVDIARLPTPECVSEAAPLVVLQPDFIRDVCQGWIADRNCVDLVAAAARHQGWEEVRVAGEQILLVK